MLVCIPCTEVQTHLIQNDFMGPVQVPNPLSVAGAREGYSVHPVCRVVDSPGGRQGGVWVKGLMVGCCYWA